MPFCSTNPLMPRPMREDELRELERGTDALGIALSETQKRMFKVYSRELLAWNQRLNLISKGDEARIVSRHFLDSLVSLPYLAPQKGLKVVDVGAGAGFPGLPLKIVRDDLFLTLVESKRKKVLFLRHMIERLELRGTEAILGRAETMDSQLDSFDVVLSRGVARLPRLLKTCYPLLKEGGTLIAYKGKRVEEEVAEARPVLRELGGRSIEVKTVDLPLLGVERSLVIVGKGSSKPIAK